MNESDVMAAAANAVSGVNNGWQVLYTAVAGILCLLGLWLYRRTAESKKLIAVNEECTRKETEIRTLHRDKQINDLEVRIDGNVENLRHIVDMHIEAHKDRDARVQGSLDGLDKCLRQIENNLVRREEFNFMVADMKSMEKLMTRIHTILEERDVRARSVSVKEV